MSVTTIACIGCGADIADSDGPTHRYLGASPGCWAVYGEVLAREYSDALYYRNHRLTVDAYSVQHPGQPSPQTVQSAALHLLSLHAVLERGLSPDRATALMQNFAHHKKQFRWLQPPATPGSVTVVDVRAASTADEHCALVRGWAESAWSAWERHHDVVRDWAARFSD
ncbi:MAG: DUF5946 family protein [Pseudomonadota bacterium]